VNRSERGSEHKAAAAKGAYLAFGCEREWTGLGEGPQAAPREKGEQIGARGPRLPAHLPPDQGAPEPTSLVMFAGLGVMGLVAARRRRKAA